MKIPIWAFFLFVLAVFAMIYFINFSEPNEKHVDELNYDSLITVLAEKDKTIDSLDLVISKIDTKIVHHKETLYVKVKSVYNLDANSSVRLFNEWTRFLSDSLNKQRHHDSVPSGPN
jgi:hypothetical protein